MRPKRFPHDPRLSSIVDQLQAIEDERVADDDEPNARRAAEARSLIVDIAMGVKQ
jgi:hypothetical protein